MSEDRGRCLLMLSTALEMERKGRKYYDEAASTCRLEVGREVFELLRDYEVKHTERIQEIYGSLAGGGGWSEELASFAPSQDLGAVFRKLAAARSEHIRAETGDIEALDVGIDFESASVKFYEEQLLKATDPLEKKFIGHMVAEERDHLRTLTDMRYFYTDPEGWFMEKEHAGLDGA